MKKNLFWKIVKAPLYLISIIVGFLAILCLALTSLFTWLYRLTSGSALIEDDFSEF